MPTSILSKHSSFARRAYKHVNNFIRVQIHLRDGTEFPLTLDVNNSLDYVAKQIEAEATFRNIGRSESSANALDDLSKAIDVYQLYDAVEMAIPFSALVRDILKFDDDIYPVTSIEEFGISSGPQIFLKSNHSEFCLTEYDQQNQSRSEDTNQTLDFSIPSLPLPDSIIEFERETETTSFVPQVISVPPVLNSEAIVPVAQAQPENQNQKETLLETQSTSSSLEERLYSVLHNKESLRFFKNFCIQEFSIENILFWLEVEAFRETNSEEQRILFSQHILSTYIKRSAPLALNLDFDLSKTVSHYTPSSEKTLFDELQSFVFMLIKQSSYTSFENSELFEKFVQFKAKEPINYQSGVTTWELADFIPITTKLVDRTSGDAYLDSRATLLTELHDRYFADSVEFKSEYFNTNSRKLQRKATVAAKKKKTPFIMRDASMDPKKKNKKLHNFFGENVEAKSIAISTAGEPSLVVGSTQQPNLKEKGSDRVFEERKSLTAEEKALQQKRVKKLGNLLGTGTGQSEIMAQQHTKVSSLLSDVSSTDDHDNEEHIDGADDSLGLQADDNGETTANLRKKAGKLAGFFGDHGSLKEMKFQKMCSELSSLEEEAGLQPEQAAMIDGISENISKMLEALVDDSTTANDSNFSELDELPPEEKVLLQKQARELASVLKAIKEGGTLPGSGRISGQKAAPTVEAARLEKLSQMTGEKIDIKDLKSSRSSEAASGTRPMTIGEKKIFKKKSSKLEQILGNSVPLDSLIITQRTDEANETPLTPFYVKSPLPREETQVSVSSNMTDESEPEKLGKLNQITRVRKLQKLLGVTAANDSLQELQDLVIAKTLAESSTGQPPQEEQHGSPANLETLQTTLGSDERTILHKRIKKLQEMFGSDVLGNLPPSATQQSNLSDVVIDTHMGSPKVDISAFDTNEWIEGPSVDKKKKADKLTGFFGYQMTTKELKLQSLVSQMSSLVTQRMSFNGGSHSSVIFSPEERSILEDILEAASNSNLPEQDAIDDASILNPNKSCSENVSSMPNEERILLQKRAKKLLDILGGAEGYASSLTSEVMLQNHAKLPSHTLDEPLSFNDDLSKFDTNEWIEGTEVDKKRKAGKLAGFFGFQVTPREMKFQNMVSRLASVDTVDLGLRDCLTIADTDNVTGNSRVIKAKSLVGQNVQFQTQQLEVPLSTDIASPAHALNAESFIFPSLQKESSESAASSSIKSKIVSDDRSDELDTKREAQSETARLRKLQRILGVEGDELTPDLVMEIQNALEAAARREEELLLNLLELESKEQEQSKALTVEEKAVLQKRAKKLHGLLGTKSDGAAAVHIQNQIKAPPDQIIEKFIDSDDDLRSKTQVCKNDEIEKFDTNEWVEGREVDKRKKADKLAGFFGGQLPTKELKLQKLLNDLGTLQSSICSIENDYAIEGTPTKMSVEHQLLLESIQENAKKLLDNLADEFTSNGLDSNPDEIEMEDLSTDEKIALQRRARELLSILNAVKEGKPIPLTHSANFQQHSSTPQQNRLEKISHLTGEKIDEERFKDTISDASAARPLSPGEKRGFQKKSIKLERMFGNTVPVDAVITYSPKKDHGGEDGRIDNEKHTSPLQNRSSTISRAIETVDSQKVDRKTQMMRARKLKKMLGIDEAASISKEAARQLIEQNPQLAETEAEKKRLIDEMSFDSLSYQLSSTMKPLVITSSKTFHHPPSAASARKSSLQSPSLPVSKSFHTFSHFGAFQTEQSAGSSPKQSLLSVVASAISRRSSKALLITTSNSNIEGAVAHQDLNQPTGSQLQQLPKSSKTNITISYSGSAPDLANSPTFT